MKISVHWLLRSQIEKSGHRHGQSSSTINSSIMHHSSSKQWNGLHVFSMEHSLRSVWNQLYLFRTVHN